MLALLALMNARRVLAANFYSYSVPGKSPAVVMQRIIERFSPPHLIVITNSDDFIASGAEIVAFDRVYKEFVH